jgi:hypothetical protein
MHLFGPTQRFAQLGSEHRAIAVKGALGRRAIATICMRMFLVPKPCRMLKTACSDTASDAFVNMGSMDPRGRALYGTICTSYLSMRLDAT